MTLLYTSRSWLRSKRSHSTKDREILLHKMQVDKLKGENYSLKLQIHNLKLQIKKLSQEL